MRFGYFLILVLLMPATLPAVTLSWEDCVRLASESNPDLVTARNEWLSVQQNETVALSGFLPSLSAQTSVTQTGSSSQSGGTGAIVSNGVVISQGGSGSKINTNYVASLNLKQNLFNGMEDYTRYQQSKYRTQASFWAFEQVKSTVTFSLKEAFANLAYAQESLELSRSIENRRESNYKLVSVRYDNGRENKGSVLLAEAYYEQAKLDVIRAVDALNVAKSKLLTLLNKDYLEDVRLEGKVPMIGLEEKKDIALLALETPSYKQSEAQEISSGNDSKIAHSNFLPSLDLTGNLLRQGQSYFPERERWNVALTLTIPLFDGFKDYATVKSAVFTRYAAESRKRSALVTLIPKLRDAQNQARQSDIKYGIDEKFQKASGTRAEIARAKYNNGLITFEDWDIIENELIQRQTSFLQSKRDRIVKYATWENLLGRRAIQ
jgi:outer membrane protein TolC